MVLSYGTQHGAVHASRGSDYRAPASRHYAACTSAPSAAWAAPDSASPAAPAVPGSAPLAACVVAASKSGSWGTASGRVNEKRDPRPG